MEEIQENQDVEIIGSPIEVDYRDLYAMRTREQELLARRHLDMMEETPDNFQYIPSHIIINNPPNYFDAFKRWFLSKCIRRLHVRYNQGHNITREAFHYQPTRDYLWERVNSITQQQEKTRDMEMMQNVQRKLFRSEKPSRKNSKPTRRSSCETTKLFNFGAARRQIGRKKVRRSFTQEAHLIVHKQLIAERLRKEVINNPSASRSLVVKAKGMLQVDAVVIADICKYHLKDALERESLDSTTRNNVQKHRRILEDSVRSLFCTKSFMDLDKHEQDRLQSILS